MLSRLNPCPRGRKESHFSSCYYSLDLHWSKIHLKSLLNFKFNSISAYTARSMISSQEGYKKLSLARSIFMAKDFGRYVVTLYLKDSNLHGHLPAVLSLPHILCIFETIFALFNPSLGSTLIASSAYQNKPTKSNLFNF